MKKIIALMLLFAATIAVSTPASAGIKFGFKGGLNVSSLSFDQEVFNSSNRMGFFIGPTTNISIPLLGFGVDVSALYDYKSSKVDGQTINHSEIVIPINLRYNVGLSSIVGIYFAAGPQFGFNVGDKDFNWTSPGDLHNTFQLKKSNLSVNIGAGVTLIKHLEIGVAYNIGLGKTGDGIFQKNVGDIIEDKSNTNAWRMSVAYYF